MTPTIVEFLTARLDEFEYILDHEENLHRLGCPADNRDLPLPCTCGLPDELGADITAKRLILEEYERAHDRRHTHPDDLASAGALLALHGVVKALSLPHADRPDYQERPPPPPDPRPSPGITENADTTASWWTAEVSGTASRSWVDRWFGMCPPPG